VPITYAARSACGKRSPALTAGGDNLMVCRVIFGHELFINHIATVTDSNGMERFSRGATLIDGAVLQPFRVCYRSAERLLRFYIVTLDRQTSTRGFGVAARGQSIMEGAPGLLA